MKYEDKSSIASTVYSGVFLLLMQIGTTLTPPKTLNNNDFPSITGKPDFGPISPKPNIAVPSVTIALTFLYPLEWVLFLQNWIRFY